ncbi:alpha/beta hydrolase [Micromonospora musae]|uniref:alpha/beta fold hydrolase n=1 Tax=Micromonospora musae TaxID=1894970 RepID=UPI0033EA5F03
MADFLLLHGTWNTARHWWKLIPELQKRGHRAAAIDLPGDDPAATTESFVATIESAIDDPQDTVLVAHSAAGLWAPIAAERRQVSELVLLAGLMPRPGFSWIDQFADQPLQPDFAAAQTEVIMSTASGGPSWSAEKATNFFYHDAEPSDVAEAVRFLRPEYASVAYQEKTPLTGRPSVATRYIWCTEDRTVSHDWMSKAAPDRFGARIVEFESSHSPFVSRPAELAELLAEGH